MTKEVPSYTTTRQFDASPAQLWQGFTNAEILSEWYGPGVKTIIHELDVRVGGVWRNEMDFGKFQDYSRMDYSEVVPNERLRWDHNSTDANFDNAPSAMMADWPATFDTVVTIEADGGGSTLTLTQSPKNATEAEIANFAEKMAGMDKGWSAGFDLLAGLLAQK